MRVLNKTLNEKYFNTFVLMDGCWGLYPPIPLTPHFNIHPFSYLILCLLRKKGADVWELTNPQTLSLIESVVNNINLNETIRESE